jgi:hypothetical protein
MFTQSYRFFKLSDIRSIKGEYWSKEDVKDINLQENEKK